MTITDEMISAYVDGELNEDERDEIARRLLTDAALQRSVAQERALRTTLSAHYASIAAEPVPERFEHLLGASARPAAPDNVISLDAARAQRSQRATVPASWRNLAAMAATLVLGVAIGHYSAPFAQSDFATSGGAMVAQSNLAHALSTQLASNQPRDASIRIGVSFHDQDDHLCRIFQSMSADGIACQQDKNWIVKTTMAINGARSPTTYQQAGSASPLVMQAAQAMMKGAPLDEKAEREALQSNSK